MTANPELENSLGHKRKSAKVVGMSGVGGKADLDFRRLDVCL